MRNIKDIVLDRKMQVLESIQPRLQVSARLLAVHQLLQQLVQGLEGARQRLVDCLTAQVLAD